MDTLSTTGWAEDVFAYDDYGPRTATPAVAAGAGRPVPDQRGCGRDRRAAAVPLDRLLPTLQDQAKLHAQVNQHGPRQPAYSGVLAWCGIDYASLVGGARNWQNLRWPGVLDTFRVPKPGASFYRSRSSPLLAPVILPAFYWDFGPSSPATGPGPNAILATNCDQLSVYVDGALLTTVAGYCGVADPGNLRSTRPCSSTSRSTARRCRR